MLEGVRSVRCVRIDSVDVRMKGGRRRKGEGEEEGIWRGG